MAERDIVVNGGSDNARTLASGDRPAKLMWPFYADTDTDLQPSGTTLETLLTLEFPAETLNANHIRIVGDFEATFSNATRRRHQISFNSTLILDFDTSDANNTASALQVKVIRESSSVVKCIGIASYTGTITTGCPQFTRITGLDLVNNDYNLTYAIRNYTTASDSVLRSYAVYLQPGP